MPAPDADLTQIFDAMVVVEEATLNDAALGEGLGIKKAYAGMPGKISDAKLPCIVRWPSEGDYWFGHGQYDVVPGSETPASLHDQKHLIGVAVVVAKRDNSLIDASREAARWINLLPEKAYAPNNTLGGRANAVRVYHYNVVERVIGDTPYIIVQWPIEVTVVRQVISSGGNI